MNPRDNYTPTDGMLSCPACKNTHGSGRLGRKTNDDTGGSVCPQCGFQYPSTDSALREFERLTEDLDTYPRHVLDDEEVLRRLPALKLIEDPGIRAETLRLSARAPAYFWAAPATKSDYHQPLCRRKHGLWIHTSMVSQAVEDLIWTYQERDLINERDIDAARSAAILHDQLKLGPHEDPEDSSTSDHGLRMADIIIEETTLPNSVGHAVACHMGPSDYYEGPAPIPGSLNDLVHMADYAASRPGWEISAPGPLPEEISEIGVREIIHNPSDEEPFASE